MKQITQNLRWLVTLLAMIVSIGVWATEYKLTISASDFTTTNYYSNNKEKTSIAVGTTDATKTIEVKWTSNQVMKVDNNGVDNMQWQKNNGYLYNSTNLGTIKSVSVTSTAGTFTTYYGTSVHPMSGTAVGNGFFTVKVGDTTGTTSKIEVVFDNNSVATPIFSVLEGEYTEAQSVEISCATEGATIYYTTDGTDPTNESTRYTGAVTISSTTTLKAIAIKDGMNNSEVATALYTISISDYIIDFEKSLESYVDWVFANIGIHNSGITAHGGTYYGANVNVNGNAVESATIQTKEKVANPATFTCYVSKESTNTNISSIWCVEVSSDGENWEDVASQSATSMNKGEWIEVTADLSNYSNVYVRLRYNGTNAIRTVDDISITLRGTPTVATPTFSPAGGSFTGTQSVTISCETTGAVIYYTINGTTPSASNGTLYEDEITISATTTVKAIAIMDNESSEIASATYEKVLSSAELEYSASSAEVTFNETPYTLPTLSNPYAVSVTYSSSKEAVATVNPTTGEVTISGVGTTIITATFAGNDDYMAGSASYTLKVNPMNSTEIDLVNNESVTFANDSWTNVSSGSYPSGETEKPFIGSDGTSTTWNYKKVLKTTYNELQFQSSNGQLSSPKVNCPDGCGYKVTIIFSSNTTKPSGSLVITASTGENASISAPRTGVDASLFLNVCGWSNVTIKNNSSNALYVTEIKFERVEVETMDVTISDKAKIDNEYYATFSNSETALHFGAVKGLNAYIVETAEKESSAITLLEVAKVPANTGLLVCGTTPKTYKVPVIPSTSADEIFNNMLHPSTGMTGDGKSVFILANGNKGLGFYIVKNGSSLKSNQAYLKIDNGTSPEIKTFFSLGGDYVNDINQIKTETLPKNNCLYDMNGQRVAAPLKGGLYIKNGKKFLFQSKNK